MEIELYSIYDARENKYYPPIYHSNDATAMRAFENECMHKGNLYDTHPQDFILYNIGTFYMLTGEIIARQSPQRVCAANDFIRKE